MAAAGVVGGAGNGSSSWMQFRGTERKHKKVNRVEISCSYSSSVKMDPYKTLRIRPGASASEVKKAFRKLALKYHPDVCRGSDCGVKFHQINEAYDIVMVNLRRKSNETETYKADNVGIETIDEPLRGKNDPDWNLWEEWMGWEGAGIRDYSSHINPYI